jgi:hypothetical protein
MKMSTRSQFYQLALEANERQSNVRDDVLPVPTLDERVSLYLRAVHGNREFTDQEHSNARDVLLNSMAAEIAAQAQPEVAERRPLHPYEAAPQYSQSVQYKEAIRVVPIARRRPDRNIGPRLNGNGGNVGVSLDASLHRGGGFRAVTTGPRAPTAYLSSLALDSACPLGAACGADRITTQRGRCTRDFSQAATRAANIV